MNTAVPLPKTALVTGASSGIGLALARAFARRGYGLVLLARDRARLDAVKAELGKAYGVGVRIIAADLAAPGAAERIFAETEGAGIPIGVLVNNAGFAEYGPFAEKDGDAQLGMIALNISAVTDLTHRFLRKMLERGAGKILNVASTAAFQPGPLMAVYYASKAYVLSLSEALREEVRGRGVAITALCPGPTESDFFKKQPQMLGSRLIRRGTLMSADRVAEAGYDALMKNKAVVIPGVRNKMLAFASRVGPRGMVTKISRWMLEQ